MLFRSTGPNANITTGGTSGNYVSGGNVLLAANLNVGTTAKPVFTAAANLAVNASAGNVYVQERDDVALRDLKDDRATLVTNNAGGAYFNVSVGNGSTQGNLIVGNTVATLSTSANVTLVANGSVELNAAVGNTSVTFTRVEATGPNANITTGGVGNYVSGGNVLLSANLNVGTVGNVLNVAAANLAVNAGAGNV